MAPAKNPTIFNYIMGFLIFGPFGPLVVEGPQLVGIALAAANLLGFIAIRKELVSGDTADMVATGMEWSAIAAMAYWLVRLAVRHGGIQREH